MNRERILRQLSEIADIAPPPDDDVTNPDVITPRQAVQIGFQLELVDQFGPYDHSNGPDGCNYEIEPDNAAAGLACQNCVFYGDPGSCDIVEGPIDPAGLCKFWVIPADDVQAEAARKFVMKKKATTSASKRTAPSSTAY